MFLVQAAIILSQAMTSRAKNLQVIRLSMLWISVNVMYSQRFLAREGIHFIPATYFTLIVGSF